MDAIYIEKIYHNKELVGIGLICHTREQAVKFLRGVKKDLLAEGVCQITDYSEDELRMVYDSKICKTTYEIEKRYVI